MNTTYTIQTPNYRITSKQWNQTMIVRVSGLGACSLRRFYDIFGYTGLERLIRYASACPFDNMRARVQNHSVYIHFK